MLIPGLVSITFRQLTVAEVVDLAARANLRSIEWGSDVHVPPGNPIAAREARRRTEEAGLSIAAYGSYYRVGKNEREQAPFAELLAGAVELGAPTIRVWAGTMGSEATTAPDRAKIVADAQRIGELAAEAGVSISFEFHGETLTDTHESAVRLLEEIDHSNVFSLWQPAVGVSHERASEGLRTLLPRLTNVHVFSWLPGGTERLPLAAGATRWLDYLALVKSTERDHHLLMEFVRNDSPEALLEDAIVLREWLSSDCKSPGHAS